MRSAALAVATAVALLTNATVAHAGSPAPATTAVAGYCEWSAEPDLFELTELVGDADCASDAAVVVDPHIVAEVIEREVYEGEREMGKPSGTEREIRFAWFPAPFADADHPGEVVFAMNQYQSYKDLKTANGRWMNTVSTFGEKAGDVSKHFLLGPTWMQNGGAAGVKTAIDVIGAAAFQAPFIAMAPYTAGISMLPSTAMTAEALFLAPTGTAHGASEFVDGLRAGNVEQMLEGGAEFCGNVGIVLLSAAPAVEVGNALAPAAKPATSLKIVSANTSPKSVGAAAARKYEASPKHPMWARGDAGNISKAPKNGGRALENSVEVSEKTRVGIDYETGEFVVFNRTHPNKDIWHGHVRTWEQVRNGSKPLEQEMRNALVKSDRATRRGKIIDAPEWGSQ